jgi:hypothetical protein
VPRVTDAQPPSTAHSATIPTIRITHLSPKLSANKRNPNGQARG